MANGLEEVVQQGGNPDSPTSRTLADGGWIVSWWSGLSLYQQRHDADGLAVGGESLVTTATEDLQELSTAGLADGGFVMTWTKSDDIHMQIYDADGLAVGSEVSIDTTTSGGWDSDITALSDGGFIVNWFTPGGISLRQFNEDGTPDDETSISEGNNVIYEDNSDVAMLKNGGWIVAWAIKDGYDPEGTNPHGIYLQRHDADGDAVGDPVTASAVKDAEDVVVTALDDGGWIVTWHNLVNGFDPGVYQQHYDVDGKLVGDTARIDTSLSLPEDTYPGSKPIVATLPDGGWVVVWLAGEDYYDAEYHEDWYTHGIYARVFDADGNAISEATQISQGGEDGDWDDRSAPSIAVLDDGSWVVSWRKGLGDHHEIDQIHMNADGTFRGKHEAPAGTDTEFTVKAGHALAFEARDFGFSDPDHPDHFTSVVISAVLGKGKLTLDGAAVHAGDEVAVADLDGLVWTPGKNGTGEHIAALKFQVRDDGGDTDGNQDLDQTPNTIKLSVYSKVVEGTNGNDELIGTHLVEKIDGRGGNDRLTGLEGSDTFVFKTGYGRDVITDFDVSGGGTHDIIDLSKLDSVRSYYDLFQNHLEQHGDKVWILGDDGDKLILKNTDVDHLIKLNFLL